MEVAVSKRFILIYILEGEEYAAYAAGGQNIYEVLATVKGMLMGASADQESTLDSNLPVNASPAGTRTWRFANLTNGKMTESQTYIGNVRIRGTSS